MNAKVCGVDQSKEPQRSCPMCGETMRLKRRTRVEPIPGLPEQKSVDLAEWECPECDYFEEYDEGADSG